MHKKHLQILYYYINLFTNSKQKNLLIIKIYISETSLFQIMVDESMEI